MRAAHPRETAVGIRYYVSDSDGIGGRLRTRPEHFRVQELEQFSFEPISVDSSAYPYLVLRITLRNWETGAFASQLADGIEGSRERIDWAGTKDRRAVSTQLFTVRDAEPGDIPDISGADIEVVGRAGRQLQFGDLVGNAFTIVIADPERPEHVDEIAAELADFAGGRPGSRARKLEEIDPTDSRTVGVPNFFGQQRFGSHRPVTHEVGFRILDGDWKSAVLAYVGNPAPAEPEATRLARAHVENTENWAAALEKFPDHLSYERAMLHRLVESDETASADFRAALQAVPQHLQRLFIHAAQSLLFNRILSERLERGLPFDRPVTGDLVCFSDPDVSVDMRIPDPDRIQQVTPDRLSTMITHCERGRAFVTAPLVGTESAFASEEPGAIEQEVLSNVGIEPSDFELPAPFGSTGTRRSVFVGTDVQVEQSPLSLAFSLPKGSYATVLLREFLKTDPIDL